MHLGQIIKAYREERSCSMAEFSRRAGLSKAYISILERNTNPSTNKPATPSLATIRAVAGAMGMEVNALIDLLGGDGEQGTGDRLIDFPIIADIQAGYEGRADQALLDLAEGTEQELARDFSRLSPSQRQAIRFLVRELAAGQKQGG